MSRKKEYKVEDINVVIENYQLAQKQQSSARTIIAIITLFILGVYVGLIWNSLNNFKHNKLPDLSQEVTFDKGILHDTMFKHLSTSLNYLAPSYTEAYQKAFVRDKSIYGDVITQEFRKLESYIQSITPTIEKSIKHLLTEQEYALQKELKPFFNKDQQDFIIAQYTQALEARVYSLHLREDAFNQTVRKSSIQRPIGCSEEDHFLTSSQYSIGLFLELLGLEMQIKSKAI